MQKEITSQVGERTRKFSVIESGAKSGDKLSLVYRQYNGNEWGYSVVSGYDQNRILKNGTLQECEVYFDAATI